MFRFFFFVFFFFCSYGHLIIYLFATQSVGFIIFCCFVQCVVDVVVSDEELGHDVVKEAFEEFGIAYTLISSFILRRRLPWFLNLFRKYFIEANFTSTCDFLELGSSLSCNASRIILFCLSSSLNLPSQNI